MPHGLPHVGFLEWLRGLGYVITAIITAFLLGRVLHELTHVLVANAFGYEVEKVSLHPLHGEVHCPDLADAPPRHRALVNTSPQMVGSVFGVLFAGWLVVADPNMLLAFIIGVGWFFYTFMGATGDLSDYVARQGGWLVFEQHEQLMVVALGLFIAGFLLGQASPDSAYLGPLRTEIMLGFAIAGMGVFAMSVLEYRETRE